MTEGQVGQGCSSWNVLVAGTTADTEHSQDADCKLLGRDSLSLWPTVFSEVPGSFCG